MKTVLLLLTALCYVAMAQDTHSPQAKAAIAAHIEQVRAFAEQVVADPGLIEKTAKANRAKILSGAGGQLFAPDVAPVYNIAERLYQIQEDIGLDAAVRAAELLAGLPSLSRRKQ